MSTKTKIKKNRRKLNPVLTHVIAIILLFLALFALMPIANYIDNNTVPEWSSKALDLAMMGIVGSYVLFLFLQLFGSLGNIDSEIDDKIDAMLVEEFGEDSKERQEYHAARAKDKNSTPNQFMDSIFGFLKLGAGLFIGGIVGINVLFTVLDLSPETEQWIIGIGVWVLLLGFIVILIGGAYFLSKSLKGPEELGFMQAAYMQADYETAKFYAESLLNKVPAEEANFPAAIMYAASGDLERAESLLKEGLTATLQMPEQFREIAEPEKFHIVLASIYIYMKRYREAKEALQSAIQYNKNESKIYSTFAELVLMSNGPLDIAENYLEKAFALNAQKPENLRSPMRVSLIFKGWIQARRGDYAGASARVKEAFSIKTETSIPQEKAELYFYAAHVALAQGNSQLAQDAFRRAIAADPKGLFAKLAQEKL